MKYFSLLLLAASAFAQAPRKLTLQEAEALAVQQHPQIAGARLQTQAAGQVIRETRSPYYPQLSASATANPPSEQSCAELTNPLSMALRQARCTASSAERFRRGTLPPS